MYTRFNTTNYRRVGSIILNEIEFVSSYNHNYYYNSQTEDLILETTDDDITCYYYKIEFDEQSFVKNYLGLTTDALGYGIFDDNYDGFPYKKENGEIILDDTIS